MDEMPKWMLAQDILIKAKNEIILEAIDSLHNEIKEKRLEVNGHTIKLPDKSSDIEMDMLVIGNILGQEEEIKKKYVEFMKSIEDKKTESPEIIERINELKKFLMAVTGIHILMNYAKVIDAWVLDFAEVMKIDDAAMIIAETAKRNVERIDTMEFMVKNRTFLKSDALNENEGEILKNAFEMCR